EDPGNPITASFEDCFIANLLLGTSSLSLRGCTIAGNTQVRELTLISDSLLANRVTAESAAGVIRYSYVAPTSITPPGWNCQPELASRDGSDPALCRPIFGAQGFGYAAHMRLAAIAHPGLRTGASDGGEMGVMHHVGARQREEALRDALDDS